MFDVVTFGEAMIRLAPPHFERLEQANALDLRIGGGELNVAVGASRLGLRSTWVSRLPKNALGKLLENRVRQAGVDTSHLVWTDAGRVGFTSSSSVLHQEPVQCSTTGHSQPSAR